MAGGGVEDLDAAGEAPLPWSLPMILPLCLPLPFPGPRLWPWLPLPLPLSGAFPFPLPFCKSGSGGLKSLMSRGEWALEDSPGAGGRRGVVPGAPTGSMPGAGFHGGGRSPVSRVGRTESGSRCGVLGGEKGGGGGCGTGWRGMEATSIRARLEDRKLWTACCKAPGSSGALSRRRISCSRLIWPKKYFSIGGGKAWTLAPGSRYSSLLWRRTAPEVSQSWMSWGGCR